VGQKSSVDRLAPELRGKLIELLQNPAVTQLEVVGMINGEAGKQVISKSSVNRYKQKLDRFAEKTREAREVADSYIEKYGADSRNKLGKVANEYIRLMVFDLITELEEVKESGGDIKPEVITDIIYKVSRAIKDLEQAEKLNAERTEDIRKAALAQAAEAVEQAAGQDGLSMATIEKIKKQILGL
jgi:hypothetical protein